MQHSGQRDVIYTYVLLTLYIYVYYMYSNIIMNVLITV